MERTKSTIRVVCDAGPIIHLDELGCLDLLGDFQEISLSDTVWKEISRYRPSALKRIDLPRDDCDLEVGPLDQISQQDELMVYKHDRFWACMDTIRDTEHLNSLWDSKQAEWKIW